MLPGRPRDVNRESSWSFWCRLDGAAVEFSPQWCVVSQSMILSNEPRWLGTFEHQLLEYISNLDRFTYRISHIIALFYFSLLSVFYFRRFSGKLSIIHRRLSAISSNWLNHLFYASEKIAQRSLQVTYVFCTRINRSPTYRAGSDQLSIL